MLRSAADLFPSGPIFEIKDNSGGPTYAVPGELFYDAPWRGPT